MNYKIVLGLFLAVSFYFIPDLIFYNVGLELNFWQSIPVELISMSIIFSLISLGRTVFFRKRFEGWEIYQMTASFVFFLIVIRLGFFILAIADIAMSDVTGSMAATIYIAVLNLSIYTTEILIASYFLNFFQSILGIKGRIDVPFTKQLMVTFGLVLTFAAIGIIYWGMFQFSAEKYVYGLVNGFLIIGGVPLAISIYLIRKPPKGLKLKKEDAPELFKEVKEIADYVGVGEPHEILITPTSEIAVTGIVKKRLIVGLATLSKLRKNEFKSILAHEFGHFYGGDTLAGHLVANLKVALQLLFSATAGSIIGILFGAVSLVFNIITLAYSRQVEYRADSVASHIFGGKNFSDALLNYATYSTYFERTVWASINKVGEEGKMFRNVYDFIEKTMTQKTEMELSKRLSTEKTALLSTHPGIGDRIKKVAGIKATKKPGGPGLASGYFKNFTGLQEDTTKIMTAYYIRAKSSQ